MHSLQYRDFLNFEATTLKTYPVTIFIENIEINTENS
jgi:hypothetical protein